MVRSSDELIAGRRAVAEAIGTGRAVEVLVAPGARPEPGTPSGARRGRPRTDPRARGRPRRPGFDSRAITEGDRARSARPGRTQPSLSERDLAETEWAEDAIAVVLDGIEDPQNLGAAARSAEARRRVRARQPDAPRRHP